MWGDPLRPETWVRFEDNAMVPEYLDAYCFGQNSFWPKYSDYGRSIRQADAARWASDHGYQDITAIVRRAVG